MKYKIINIHVARATERVATPLIISRSHYCSPGTPCASLAAIRCDSGITFSIINVAGLSRVHIHGHTDGFLLRTLAQRRFSFSRLPGWR